MAQSGSGKKDYDANFAYDEVAVKQHAKEKPWETEYVGPFRVLLWARSRELICERVNIPKRAPEGALLIPPWKPAPTALATPLPPLSTIVVISSSHSAPSTTTAWRSLPSLR